jgi:hypothetical protein
MVAVLPKSFLLQNGTCGTRPELIYVNREALRDEKVMGARASGTAS